MSLASGPPFASTGGGSSVCALVVALADVVGTGGADADADGTAEDVSTGAAGMSLEPVADAEGLAPEAEALGPTLVDVLADADVFAEDVDDPTGLLEPAWAAPSRGPTASKPTLATPIEPRTNSRRTRTIIGP